MHLGGEALPLLKGALEEIQAVPDYAPQRVAQNGLPLATLAFALPFVGRV